MTLHCSTHERIRWCHHENYAQRVTSYRCTYKNQEFLLIHKGHVSEENHCIKSRLLRPFSMRKSTSKSGTTQDFLLCLRSPTKSTFKCLFKDTPLWHGIMMHLRNPKEQCTSRQLGTTGSKIWHPLGLALRHIPTGKSILKNPLQRILQWGRPRIHV
jgi:hypothetical protein